MHITNKKFKIWDRQQEIDFTKSKKQEIIYTLKILKTKNNAHNETNSWVHIMNLWPCVTNLEHFTHGALEDVTTHRSMIHLKPWIDV